MSINPCTCFVTHYLFRFWVILSFLVSSVWGHSRTLFRCLHITYYIYLHITVNMLINFFANDWIQTTVLWHQTQPLCQLSHNHCSSCICLHILFISASITVSFLMFIPLKYCIYFFHCVNNFVNTLIDLYLSRYSPTSIQRFIRLVLPLSFFPLCPFFFSDWDMVVYVWSA